MMYFRGLLCFANVKNRKQTDCNIQGNKCCLNEKVCVNTYMDKGLLEAIEKNLLQQ